MVLPARLSRVWFPSGGIAVSGAEDAHSKLIRAGFLRQSNAGMFHMLPLGRRVQDKIEGLVAKRMEEDLGESWVPRAW
jgi:prolyl-tRNA synthetase